MINLFSFLFTVIISLLFCSEAFPQKPDRCENIKHAAAAVTLFTKDSLYKLALSEINKVSFDKNEHCISFGKDTAGNMISSAMLGGGATSGKVPAIANAFADLHNHPNNLPPDAGDLYGLINMNKKNPGYKTRFVVTVNGTMYALLVTDTAAAFAFTRKYPPQPPAGGQPAFPVELVDESREMKYKYDCTDEMVLAFILEKYDTGLSLLKQVSNGIFSKIFTTVSNENGRIVYKAGACP